jgi:membrane-associated protease RseP (regulator of RpoE activity)
MLWKMMRVAGVSACLVALAAATTLAQEVPEVQALDELRPPTFFSPPGANTGGAIMMHPPNLPQGVPMPQVIWQQDDAQEVIKPSDHWVGLQCGKMTPALRAQLGLDEDQGVLVEGIVDESPAAKAGIKKYDVLTAAGDRKLNKVQDLIDEIDAVKDGKLTVELIRQAKKKTLDVTPEKRPPVDAPLDTGDKIPQGEWKDFLDHLQQWEPGKDGRPSMKLQFWHPGTIFPGQKDLGKLPGNVRVEIRKEGGKPAQIEVTRDDETWKLDENHIDQLPEDVRPHIERMLGKTRGRGPLPPQIFSPPKAMDGPESLLKKQFEDINRRFDRIQKSLEELRKDRRERPKSEKKPDPKPEAPKVKPSEASA